MNASTTSARPSGLRGVGDVLARMNRLADWLQANKPTCKVMTLRRQDFDLLRKFPSASGIHENNGVVYWRSFELHALAAPSNRGPTP